MVKSIIQFYNESIYTLDELKKAVVNWNLQEELKKTYNIVNNVDADTVKFTQRPYTLKKGEKYLNENEFFEVI